VVVVPCSTTTTAISNIDRSSFSCYYFVSVGDLSVCNFWLTFAISSGFSGEFDAWEVVGGCKLTLWLHTFVCGVRFSRPYCASGGSCVRIGAHFRGSVVAHCGAGGVRLQQLRPFGVHAGGLPGQWFSPSPAAARAASRRNMNYHHEGGNASDGNGIRKTVKIETTEAGN
jgi:hypothetical protein